MGLTGSSPYTLIGPAAASTQRNKRFTSLLLFICTGCLAVIALVLLAPHVGRGGGGSPWALPWSSTMSSTRPLRPGPLVLYPWSDFWEGIGSIAMSSKQCGYLAMLMEGNLHVPDYRPGGHGDHRIWEMLETLDAGAAATERPLGKVCPVGNYINEPGWREASMTLECGKVAPKMTTLIEALEADACDTVVCSYRGERMHAGSDVLRWTHSTAYGDVRVPFRPNEEGVTRIHAHARWGDTSTGSNAAVSPGFEEYGRAKTSDLQSVADYVHHLELQSRAYTLTIFTEPGINGSMPDMPQLSGIAYDFDLTPDVRYTIANLGQCDILFTGGSQMAVLAASIATAPIVAYPDTETGYFQDSCEHEKRYFASHRLKEMMKIGAI